MKMTVGYLLENAANRYTDKIALVYEGNDYTYKEYNSRVNRLANFLKEHGVSKGDTVATLMNNSNFQVETYLSCAKIGAIFTPFNYRLKEQELEYVCRHSEAKFLIFAQEFGKEVEYLNHACATDLLVQVGGELLPKALDYEQALGCSMDKEPGLNICESDPCQLLYTSGTTGRPKGVILSHGNVLWNAMNSLLIRGDCT